jgi:hypothetical protein
MKVYQVKPIDNEGNLLDYLTLEVHADNEEELLSHLKKLKTDTKFIMMKVPMGAIGQFFAEIIPHKCYLPESQTEQDFIENCECEECKYINRLEASGSLEALEDQEVTLQEYESRFEAQSGEIDKLTELSELYDVELNKHVKTIKKLEAKIKKLEKNKGVK